MSKKYYIKLQFDLEYDYLHIVGFDFETRKPRKNYNSNYIGVPPYVLEVPKEYSCVEEYLANEGNMEGFARDVADHVSDYLVGHSTFLYDSEHNKHYAVAEWELPLLKKDNGNTYSWELVQTTDNKIVIFNPGAGGILDETETIYRLDRVQFDAHTNAEEIPYMLESELFLEDYRPDPVVEEYCENNEEGSYLHVGSKRYNLTDEQARAIEAIVSKKGK